MSDPKETRIYSTYTGADDGSSGRSSVCKPVPIDLLRRLLNGARECAEDLLAELDARYPEASRDEQPALARRYNRDVTTALATLDIVSRLEAEI